jgi:hypothetical protein
MAREIPEAVRAAAGLAATVLDEARKLPERLPGLPVRLLGLAMQASLRLQQQYSGLVARGDEVLTGLRGDAEPGMATFDEDLPPVTTPGDRPAPRSSAFDRVVELVEDPSDDLTVELTDEIVEVVEVGEPADLDAGAEAEDEGLAGDTWVTPDGTVVDVADDAPPAADEAPLADVLAFDTLAAEDGAGISDAEVAVLPADPPADVVTEAVDELAGAVDAELAAQLPESVPDDVTDDLTDDLTDDVTDDLAADTVATVADEEVAGDTGTAAADSVPDTAGPPAALTPPVEGYDGFSIPTLRGRLRSFDVERVNALLDYERATRGRAPYMTMLSNRLAKLTAPES